MFVLYSSVSVCCINTHFVWASNFLHILQDATRSADLQTFSDPEQRLIIIIVADQSSKAVPTVSGVP